MLSFLLAACWVYHWQERSTTTMWKMSFVMFHISHHPTKLYESMKFNQNFTLQSTCLLELKTTCTSLSRAEGRKCEWIYTNLKFLASLARRVRRQWGCSQVYRNAARASHITRMNVRCGILQMKSQIVFIFMLVAAWWFIYLGTRLFSLACL